MEEIDNMTQEEHVADAKNYWDVALETLQKEQFKEVMKELQHEWSENNDLYVQRHNYAVGIRSSQIAALVMLLIKKGVLP